MDARHAQYDARLTRALYRNLLSPAPSRQRRTVALLAAFSSRARPHTSVALSKIVRVEFSIGPIRRRGAGCVRKAGIGFLREETDEAAIDFVCKPKPFQHKGRIELHEARSGLDLGERGFRAVDAANADQRKRIFHAQISGGEQLARKPKQRPA